MSVRGYKDEKLVEFFNKEYGLYETLNEGTGITKLPVEALEKAIKNAKILNLDTWKIKDLQKNINWAKQNKLDYIQCYCF